MEKMTVMGTAPHHRIFEQEETVVMGTAPHHHVVEQKETMASEWHG
jgi:hypothetical protein